MSTEKSMRAKIQLFFLQILREFLRIQAKLAARKNNIAIKSSAHRFSNHVALIKTFYLFNRDSK